MPRSPSTWPERRADGRSVSSKHVTISGASCSEEKRTTVAIRLRPLSDREKAEKQKIIWKCGPTHNTITQVRQAYRFSSIDF